MKNLLQGKVAIVTGGASGLGYASAKRFVEEGALVVIADIQNELGIQVAEDLGKAVRYIHTDVTDEMAVKALVEETVKHFGKLDIMFNNAGATGEPASILEVNDKKFRKLLDLDVCSVVYGHKYAGQQFRKQGSGGSIITTASIAAMQGGWSSVSYTTAKHAIVGTIRHASKELSPYGIRTNAIAPGVILTPLLEKAFGVPRGNYEKFATFLENKLGEKQALGRYGTMDDIASAALFLASDMASYISGVVLPVDGGITAYTQSTSDDDMVAAAHEFLNTIGH